MRVFRIVFVSLIAVGVCGVVYVGLTAGLAAYMRYKTASQRTADPAAAAPATSPAMDASAASASPAARSGPPAGVEDVASLMRRKWTAPRAGLTVPPAFVKEPQAFGRMLVPAGPRTSLPPLPLKLVRGKIPRLDRERPLRFVSAEDATIPVIELAPSQAAKIALPAGPAANVPSADPGQVRVSTIAPLRDADRPAVQADPGAAAAEQLLLLRYAPLRVTGMPFVKLSIPEPTPNSFGQVMTVVPDDDAPVVSPERPVVKFVTK